MLPVLHVGPWSLDTYALMYALAFLAAGGLCWRQMAGLGQAGRKWQNGILLVLLAVFTGLYWPAAVESLAAGWLSGQPPEPIHSRVYYGLICGAAACYLYARWQRLDVRPALDRLVPCFALGFAVARVGCLAAGCCGGAVTTSPLALFLPNTQGQWAARYPTQMLSGGFELLLFALLIRRDALPAWLRPAGRTAFFYICMFCLERFVLEFLREDYRPLLGALSLPHLLVLAGLALAAGVFIWNRRAEARPEA